MSNFVKKTNKLAKNSSGFTIVELLIVVVVIAILAAITIVSYNGISKRAVESTMQQDLQSAAQLVEIDSSQNGVYPDTPNGLNNGKGLVGSGGNQLTYLKLAAGYCVSVTNSKTSSQYKITGGQIVPGTCALTNGGVVTTLAGNGTGGWVDGTGTAAQVNSPYGVAVDSNGTVYVADSYNYRIRKISPAGVVSTFAGSGVSGTANGNGTAAQFSYAYGVAVDSNGVVYVADSINNRIRKIMPNGDVTTFAGSTQGTTDGNGTAAQFYHPFGIAVNSAGVVYVADRDNNRIRKIMPNGDVTTIAGSTWGYTDGNGTAAQFAFPEGVGVDSAGVVYVGDSVNNRIRKIMPNGDVTTFAGSGTAGTTDGTGTAARFNSPKHVAVDVTGALYVAQGASIRKITPGGVVTTIAGSTLGYADGTGSAAKFYVAQGVAVDSSGVLYVGDAGASNRIRKIQ